MYLYIYICVYVYVYIYIYIPMHSIYMSSVQGSQTIPRFL